MRKTVLVEAVLSASARPVSGARAAGPHWIITTCTALLMLGLGYVAGAAPGDLDPSFDADGLVLTHFGRIDDDSPGGRSDIGASVVAQRDGKLVVAGGSDLNLNFSSGDFALVQYNPNGSLDSSFGSGGRVLTDFGGSDFASTLIVQPDGKLVARGTSVSFDATTGSDVFTLAFARYNQDGSLDASFGSGGRLLISSLSVPLLPIQHALVAEPGGKLVATAISFDEEQNSVATLVRLNPDGSLDTSFGSGGVVADFTEEAQVDFFGALVLQPDGKLVVAGNSSEVSDNGFTDSIFLARFNPNGTLDATFGSDGRVFTEGPFFTGFLLRQPDGKLVAVGLLRDSGALTLVRYNSDGSLDAGFGSGGRVVIVTGVGIESGDLVLDPDGKFVAAGESFVPGTGSVFALARFNSDGSLDASFGSGGRVFTTFSGRFDFLGSAVRSLAVQMDGKLVAAGSSNVSGDEDFALVRYLVTNERPERPPTCGGHRATMLGTPGNDTLRGTFFGRDVILGLGGNDTIRGLGGTDILCGGTGNDILIGGDESDWLYGGSGNDRLFADRGLSAVDGDDALYGGSGRDTLVGDDGNDLLSGEGGRDRLFGDRGDDALDGGGDRDRCRDRFGRNTLDNCDSGARRPPTEPPRDPPPAPCLGRLCPEDDEDE